MKQGNEIINKRDLLGLLFYLFCFVSNIVAILFMVVLFVQIFYHGLPYVTWHFLTSYPSRFPHEAGILSALVGSICIMFLTAFISVPIGVGAAIYLEEYAKNTMLTRFIKLNIKNMAGIPSIIYGLLGLTLFVKFFGFDSSILSAALTMSLLILPVIIITSQEALKAVPSSLRAAGFGIGMTQWQVVYYQVLPLAAPSMMTGIILALSRSIGETAPLIMVGGLTFVRTLPVSLFDSFSALPILIFNWTARPQKDFHLIASAAIIVLLVLLTLMNILAIYLRNHYRKKMNQIHL